MSQEHIVPVGFDIVGRSGKAAELHFDVAEVVYIEDKQAFTSFGRISIILVKIHTIHQARPRGVKRLHGLRIAVQIINLKPIPAA